MTPKSSRKKIHTKFSRDPPNIRSVINEGFEVDQILSNCSNALFGLDEKSKYVLEILAKNGPLTEYEITPIGETCYDLTRNYIRSRILGTITFPSLLDHGFLEIVSTEKHRTGKVIKKFGLTFKGILGVLSRIKLEEIYLAKKYYSEIEKLVKNDQNFIDLSILYAKSHIVLILLWSKLNHLNLLLNSRINDFFLEGRTNSHIEIGLLDNVNNDYELESYKQAGIRYFVLKHAMFSMVKKLSTHSISHLYSDKRTKYIFKHKKINLKEFFVKYCVKDWVLNLELANLNSVDKNKLQWAEHIFNEPLERGSFLEWDSEIKADKMYSTIAKKYGLRKSSVKIFTSS